MASTFVKLPLTDTGIIAGVDSYNGRTGTVASQAGDYNSILVEFTPSTAGNWDPVPTTVQQALDQLAARIAALE